ncbi:hypothetical protein CHU71_03670 [Corynebacterium sp. LK14]|nr:hypothetical protein CHU71_03670 [Corynebacterium sp. LK14]
MDGPYFAPLNPKCEVGRSFVESNRLTWRAFNAILPQPDEDAELAFADVSRKLGLTSYKAEHLFYGFKKISYLPKLRHLNKLDWFLDYDRILAIGKALQGVEERIYPFVDDALEELFTPRRPNQRLPEASRIRKVISEVLALHYCVEGEVEEDRDRYHMERYAGRGEITANLDAVTAETIDRLVRKRAEKEGISFARALAATILDPIEQKIVINVFQQADTSLAFAPGYGYIDPPEGASTREIAPGETEGYRPTEAIRAFVEARDGTCRGPGCDMPAHLTQLDHRIPYADGGKTSSDNLVCLCQRCHNIKTDGRAFYVMDPDTGVVLWCWADGTWESTVPKGLLVPNNANWRQSVAERMGAWEARGGLLSFDDATATPA